MQTVRITTSQNIDIDYDVASLGDRVAARALDYMIFMCVYALFAAIFVGYTGVGDGDGQQKTFNSSGAVILIIVWLAVCVFYDLLTEIFMNGQSIGKRSLKIKVISLNGRRPSVSQYLLRWVFRIIDFGITIGSAAIISVAFTENRQRIGDLIAGTTVVKTSPNNKFNDLIFSPPSEDYEPTFRQVVELTDKDIVLIYDVIRNFNRTRNSSLVYKLALRIKKFLNVNYSSEINEYQFLEIVLNDYNHLIAAGGI